jgi:hypothetical protein
MSLMMAAGLMMRRRDALAKIGEHGAFGKPHVNF